LEIGLAELLPFHVVFLRIGGDVLSVLEFVYELLEVLLVFLGSWGWSKSWSFRFLNPIGKIHLFLEGFLESDTFEAGSGDGDAGYGNFDFVCKFHLHDLCIFDPKFKACFSLPGLVVVEDDLFGDFIVGVVNYCV
jgi:hypothetical protein